MSRSAMVELLRGALADAAPLRDWAGLDAWAREQLDAAAERWPGLSWEVALPAFARAVARRAPAQLSRVNAVDLLLASACAAGDPRSIDVLDVLLREEVTRAVRPLRPGLVDDVAQAVRERLLVGAPRRIAEYAGDGPLGAWLRAVAVRLALNTTRVGAREDATATPPEQALADPDPELALLRARYRDAFRAAFSTAIGALTPRDRTVLKLHTLDGLSLARIGAIYRKDLSTISRWLEQVRRALLATTRERLGAQLGLGSAELESLMRAADSELTVSLARLLTDPNAP